MSIASDIKFIFKYLIDNNLLNDEHIKNLQNKDYCSEEFSSGKFPVLLFNDKSLAHQEQRKFGTPQARYYDPRNFIIKYKANEYFFTSNIFEEQRKHYYSWVSSTFGIDVEDVVLKHEFNIVEEFRDYVEQGFRKEILELAPFYFEKARMIFKSFKDFNQDNQKVFFENALGNFNNFKGTYKNYLPTLTEGTKDFQLFELIGKVVAHFDYHGYNKNVWNENEDKRVLAKAGVRQTDWVKALIQYKINNCNIESINPGSIKNTIAYVENPNSGLTMLSEDHRKMFSKNILHQEFNSGNFVEKLLTLFKEVEVPINNVENKAAYICLFLYEKEIKEKWIDENDKASCWVLGAYWDDNGEKDQTKRFIDDSVWINGFGEDSGDTSLEVVKQIQPGDLVAIKSSFTVNDSDGKRIPCLRIKAIGEVISNNGDGVNLIIDWKRTDTFDVNGLSYRKTAEEVRQKDKKLIFQMKPKMQGEVMATVKKKTNKNVIFYGPPGTGKTFKLTNEIASRFENGNASSNTALIVESFSEMPWWRVLACILIDLGKSVSVQEVLEHEFLQVKIKASESNTVRQTIWGTFQARAILESKTVNVKERRAPYVFDKNEKSEWFLAGSWKEELSDEIEIVDRVRGKSSLAILAKRYELVTFHPSYSYEDFIEGIKPVLDDEGDNKVQYSLVNGVFKKMCLKASEDPQNDYAIFIDEINRGNIPAIFGELITLIEEDKREVVSTILPYSKKPFTVPKNLFIYGTMNTADKSVEALDLALRRRFVFVEFEPEVDKVDCIYENDIIKNILLTINHRVEVLLGKDYRIGHSYFMNGNVSNFEDLKAVFKNRIIPLLKEYFYEDWEKLCLVIGKEFVEKVNNGRIKFAKGYEDSSNDFEDKNIYKITNSETWNIDTFKSIYEK